MSPCPSNRQRSPAAAHDRIRRRLVQRGLGSLVPVRRSHDFNVSPSRRRPIGDASTRGPPSCNVSMSAALAGPHTTTPCKGASAISISSFKDFSLP